MNTSANQTASTTKKYHIRDEAGNDTVLSFDEFKQEEKEAKAELESIAYGTTTEQHFSDNDLKYEWSLEQNGDIKTLEQRAEVEHQFSASAEFERQTNQTIITTQTESGKTKQTFPGLVVLGLETKAGGLIFFRLP